MYKRTSVKAQYKEKVSSVNRNTLCQQTSPNVCLAILRKSSSGVVTVLAYTPDSVSDEYKIDTSCATWTFMGAKTQSERCCGCINEYD